MAHRTRDHYLEILPELLEEIRTTSRQGRAISPVLSSYGVSKVLLYDLHHLGLLQRTHGPKRSPQYVWQDTEHTIPELVVELVRLRDRRFKAGHKRQISYQRNQLDQRRCDRCNQLIGYGSVFLSRPTMTQPLAICTACVTYFDQPKHELDVVRVARELLALGDHVYSHQLDDFRELLTVAAAGLRKAVERDPELRRYPELADHCDTLRQWLDGAERIYRRHGDRCQELHAQLGRIYTVGDLRNQTAPRLREQLADLQLQEDLQRRLRFHGGVMQEALQNVASWLRGLGGLLECRHLPTEHPQPTAA